MIDLPPDRSLDPAERDFLLALARVVVEAAVAGDAPPSPGGFAAARGYALTPALRERRGAFVTLTRRGRLRGCIGFIEGVMPLAEAVAANALSAALRDTRFPVLTVDELADLRLEVSVLSPLRAVPGPEAIEVGRHGIVLAKDGAHSVFLPQVAPEQGWDLATTLDNLALKAGLPPDAWRRDADLQVFTAEILAEPDTV